MKVKSETDLKSVYRHTSKISTGGDGDEFTASVTFNPTEGHVMRATVSIDEWREKDGVTRRAGIKALDEFIDKTVAAFRAVGPNIRTEYRT